MRKVLICRLACLLWVITLVSCGGISSGEAPLSSTQAVAAAKAALAIGYRAGDSASSVTQNLALPASGIDNSTIAWSSNNAAALTTAGVVTRPSTSDVNVTLTATITVGATSDTKAFPVTVKALMTDAQAVAAEKAALSIGYASGDSATCVTQSVTLATAGIDGSTISWATDNSAVVSKSGAVTQPATADADVTLTATISVGTASDTKAFLITVKAQMTDVQAVAAAKMALSIGYQPGDAASSVTQSLTLPVTGAAGCSVSWASSDAAISSSGAVTRPAAGDLPVTLTATITLNAVSDTKVFIVTVKAQMTDEEAVAAAKAALAIGYAQGDSESSVTQNLILPVTGGSGSTVSWASSDSSVVSTGGIVQRPATGSANLALTATISLRAASDTEEFLIIVKGQISDSDAVAAAKAALNIVYASGDSAASVTQNVGLPASGSDGCTVEWASDTPAVISIAGTVTRPQSSTLVTLTAMISSHDTSNSKQFVLTVQPLLDDAAVVAADKAALTIGFGPGDSASHVT